MSRIRTSRIAIVSLAALVPLGLAWGAAAAGGLPAEAYGSAPSCDIRVAYEDGGLVLEGLVFAPAPVAGSYELVVEQGSHGGQSSIRQGGEFTAAPGSDPSLGMVSLPGGDGYTATLIVHWDDGAPDCTRHAGSGQQL